MKNFGKHFGKRVGLMCFLLSAVTAFGTSSTAFADADPANFVVKIRCVLNDSQYLFEGSGMLVQYQKAVYVLTSEHVVFHDNDKEHTLYYQHEGKNPQKMIYINSDWGMGLAILKAPDEAVSDDLPKLEDLAKTSPAQVDTQAISAGFPLRSQSMLVDIDGKVSSTTHTSMVLADIENMLEIKGAHGEYGMSGGAVLNGDLAPIGVLSHETPDEQNKILFAVPMAQAAQWAIHFISDPNAKPRLVRTTQDLLTGNDRRVRNGRLIIDWQNAWTGEGTKHPASVSMGWDDTLQKLGLNPPTETYPSDFMDSATRRISAFLENGHDVGFYGRVTVERFRPRDVSRYKEMKELSSFVEFFRNLKNSDLKPMASFSRQGGRSWWDIADEYCEASEKIKYGTSVNLGDQLWPALNAIAELSSCYKDYQPIEEYKMTYPLEALDQQDIEDVMNNPKYKEGWAILQNYSQTYNSTQYDNTRAALQKVEKLLGEFNL